MPATYPDTSPEDLAILQKVLTQWPVEKDPVLPWSWAFLAPGGVPVRVALAVPRTGGMARLIAMDMRNNHPFDLRKLPDREPMADAPQSPTPAHMTAKFTDTSGEPAALLREMVGLLREIRDALLQR